MQRLSSPNPGSLSSADLNSSDVTPTSSCSTGKKSKSSYTDVTSSASSEKTYTLKGTRLIVLHNFQGKAFDDLPVRPGEYVYANLKDQIVPGFIWAYSPNTKKSGFIPEDHVKEPVVTDIWKMIKGSYSLVIQIILELLTFWYSIEVHKCRWNGITYSPLAQICN